MISFEMIPSVGGIKFSPSIRFIVRLHSVCLVSTRIPALSRSTPYVFHFILIFIQWIVWKIERENKTYRNFKRRRRRRLWEGRKNCFEWLREFSKSHRSGELSWLSVLNWFFKENNCRSAQWRALKLLLNEKFPSRQQWIAQDHDTGHLNRKLSRALKCRTFVCRSTFVSLKQTTEESPEKSSKAFKSWRRWRDAISVRSDDVLRNQISSSAYLYYCWCWLNNRPGN